MLAGKARCGAKLGISFLKSLAVDMVKIRNSSLVPHIFQIFQERGKISIK
jgi:hypothetical protein